MSDIGKTIKPLAVKMEELAKDSDTIVKAVDPEQIKSIVKDFAGLSAKLNAAADKVDGVLTNLNGLLATGDSKGMIRLFTPIGFAAAVLAFAPAAAAQDMCATP